MPTRPDDVKPMPRCPKCKSETSETIALSEPDDGRGAKFTCKCGHTYRANGPHAERAAREPRPRISSPPPATSRTGAPRSSSSSSRDE